LRGTLFQGCDSSCACGLVACVARSVLDWGFGGRGENAASRGCGIGGFVWAFHAVVHPCLVRIHGATCVALLSFDLSSSHWMDLGVGGLLLNFIVFVSLWNTGLQKDRNRRNIGIS
jgi:hypothetical protein